LRGKGIERRKEGEKGIEIERKRDREKERKV